MRQGRYNLAIETSSRAGSITLGHGDERVATLELTQQRRHDVGLMVAIDRVCREHGLGPADLAELYVSVGPGSFTGLRVATAAVKMIALARGARVVAVPTLDVVAQNAPPPEAPPEGPNDAGHAAVGLNLKRQTVYSGVYRRQADGRWALLGEPALRTMAELLAAAPRPVVILGDPLPELPEPAGEGVRVLPPEQAAPRSDAVWRLGRAMAAEGRYTDAMELVPLYVRRPEAVEIWDRRHGPEPIRKPKSAIRNSP